MVSFVLRDEELYYLNQKSYLNYFTVLIKYIIFYIFKNIAVKNNF